MKVPVAKPFFDECEEHAVTAVLRTGWVSQGPKTAAFEAALAAYMGIRHGVGVNSGSSALHIALLASNLAPGDEVIVPAFTCVATLNPIEHMGARPVLVDIELDTFGIDPAQLEHLFTPRTKAIVLVHLFGAPAAAGQVCAITAGRGVTLIEDCALGLGAVTGGRHVGTFGGCAFVSFHPRKMITTGEGGMVLTNSDELARRARELRNYGASTSALDRHSRSLFDLPEYNQVGFNFKMTDIQAAVGLEQARKLPLLIERRREVARRYDEGLAGLDWLRLPAARAGEHAYQSYVCMVEPALRGLLFAHLAAAGVASVQAAQAMPAIGYYRRKYGWRAEDYPRAALADAATVCLPIYPSLSTAEQDYVIERVREFRPQ